MVILISMSSLRPHHSTRQYGETDSIAPNDVQILTPLVSGLTPEIVFWQTPGLEVSRTAKSSTFFCGSAHLFRRLLHKLSAVVIHNYLRLIDSTIIAICKVNGGQTSLELVSETSMRSVKRIKMVHQVGRLVELNYTTLVLNHHSGKNSSLCLYMVAARKIFGFYLPSHSLQLFILMRCLSWTFSLSGPELYGMVG
jgi:hypothetical protein